VKHVSNNEIHKMLAEQNIYPKIVHFTRLGAKSCYVGRQKLLWTFYE